MHWQRKRQFAAVADRSHLRYTARMLANLSDETLMLSYRDGDLAAFAELYQRHRVGLYRFVSWRSPRQDWVDEIVQDCWAGLHGARARYQPQAIYTR